MVVVVKGSYRVDNKREGAVGSKLTSKAAFKGRPKSMNESNK